MSSRHRISLARQEQPCEISRTVRSGALRFLEWGDGDPRESRRHARSPNPGAVPEENHDHPRPRDPHLGAQRRGLSRTRAAGGRRRLRSGHHPRHRPRRSHPRRRDRLRPRLQADDLIERRVLHGHRRDTVRARPAAVTAGGERADRPAGTGRRRRRRHGQDTRTRHRVLRAAGPGRGGPQRRPVQEAAHDHGARLHLAHHGQVDQLPWSAQGPVVTR